jgi:hypothetical protein
MYFKGSNDILVIWNIDIHESICEIPTLRSHLKSMDLGL